MKVKIFIDFWNFQLSWNEYHRNNGQIDIVQIPWDTLLTPTLTGLLGNNVTYAGTHVYASIAPSRDRGLEKFLNVMNRFRGYTVNVVKRKPRSATTCPECHKKIKVCPHCHEVIKRTIEKGVDTFLIIDMIQFAEANHYDAAILLSADRDFIRAIEFVQSKSKKVFHVWYKNKGNELRGTCWDHFLFDNIMGQLLPDNV